MHLKSWSLQSRSARWESNQRVENISDFRKKIIFAILMVASFITAMSTTVTGNMIPNMMAYFEVSSSAAQWLTSGATLLSGITIPVTAFLIKNVPNKAYFLTAIGLFTAGSLVASLANKFALLLIFRLVQAMGCGMLLSFAQVLILAMFPKEKHGTMMAVYSMAASVSSMVGPTYAGLLMDYVGWRGVFASLFAVGCLLLVSGFIFVKNVLPKQEASINIGYVLLSSAGFAAFIIGLNQMPKGFFRISSGGCMAFGIMLLATFSVLQLRSNAPMLNVTVFKNEENVIYTQFTPYKYAI